MQYSRDQRVHVQLRVEKSLLEYPGNPSDYYVAVSGTGLQLGNNNPEIAPRCQLDRHNIWVKDIWPPKNSHVDFRFLVVHRFSNTIKAMEDVVTRRLFVGDTPIVVEASFDKPGFSVTNENKFTSFNMKLNNLDRRQTKYTGPRISEKPKPLSKNYNTMTFAINNTKDRQKYINNTWHSRNMKETPKNIQLKNKELEQEIEAKREGLVRLKIKEEESRLLKSSEEESQLLKSSEEESRLLKSSEEESQLLKSSEEESRLLKSSEKESQLLKSNEEESQLLKSSEESRLLKSSEKESQLLKSSEEESRLLKSNEEESRLLESNGKGCQTLKSAEESVQLRKRQEEQIRKLLHQRKDESRQVKTQVEECPMATTQGKEDEKESNRMANECPDLTQNFGQDDHNQEKQIKQEYDNTKERLAKEIDDIQQKLDEGTHVV